MTATSPLPGRVLRIGVTGTRKLDEAQLYFVRPAVEILLRSVVALAAGTDGKSPRLQLLSPLAEGADRLAADCALAQGFELVCPLPFPQAMYEDDFASTAGSVADFRRLLARAGTNVLALDGARDDPKQGIYAEARSYEAVGRLVVRNCDLIIGIWNGLPGEGRGGTADTIRYAARFGPPVVWIHATDGRAEPRWIEEAHDLRHGAPNRPVDHHLDIYLKRLLHPPKPYVHHSHASLVHTGCHRIHAWAGTAIRYALRRPNPTPLTIFLQERKHPVWGPWKLNKWFMDSMTWRPLKPHATPKPPEPPPPMPLEAEHWRALYDSPDNRADEYAARHRSSYVWTFLLGAIALTAAAAALAFSDSPGVKIAATGTELVALTLILLLVVADSILGWQTRSIEYRLLGELCRKQQAVAPLAGIVPRASAWATTGPESKPAKDQPFIEPISWVSWLFSAWLRDTALPIGTIDAARVEAAQKAAICDLIAPQIAYHEKRCVRSHSAGKRLVRIGELLFAAVLILVAFKFHHLLGKPVAPIPALRDPMAWAGFFCAMLPGASAAFVGIRAYAELEMLAEQSAVMLKALRYARCEIEDLDPHTPLASQELGMALARVATLMLEDLEGWARLFRGKILDA